MLHLAWHAGWHTWSVNSALIAVPTKGWSILRLQISYSYCNNMSVSSTFAYHYILLAWSHIDQIVVHKYSHCQLDRCMCHNLSNIYTACMQFCHSCRQVGLSIVQYNTISSRTCPIYSVPSMQTCMHACICLFTWSKQILNANTLLYSTWLTLRSLVVSVENT